MDDIPSWARSPILIALALLVLLFVVWRMIDEMPLDDETKQLMKTRLLQGVLIAIALAFAVPAVLGMSPVWAAAAAGGALAVTGALEVVRRAGSHATGVAPAECGEEGTWGQLIDGHVCLF